MKKTFLFTVLSVSILISGCNGSATELQLPASGMQENLNERRATNKKPELTFWEKLNQPPTVKQQEYRMKLLLATQVIMLAGAAIPLMLMRSIKQK